MCVNLRNLCSSKHADIFSLFSGYKVSYGNIFFGAAPALNAKSKIILNNGNIFKQKKEEDFVK
jgi:hypothetical protein